MLAGSIFRLVFGRCGKYVSSRASSSGDLAGSVPRGLCVVVPTPYAGASSVLGRLDGMSNVGCTRHPSKK